MINVIKTDRYVTKRRYPYTVTDRNTPSQKKGNCYPCYHNVTVLQSHPVTRHKQTITKPTANTIKNIRFSVTPPQSQLQALQINNFKPSRYFCDRCYRPKRVYLNNTRRGDLCF